MATRTAATFKLITERANPLFLPPVAFLVYGISIFAYLFDTRGAQIGPDSAKYLLSGSLTLDGQITYAYLFAPKPPGNHLVATGIAALFEGRLTMYIISVLLMLAVATLTIALVELLVYELTGSVLSAVVAGVVPFTLERYGASFVHGLLGKYIVIALFLAALYLVARNRTYAAVALAGLTPAFWQAAIVFPLVTLIAALPLVRRPWRYIAASLGIWSILAALVALPYVLAGAGGQLLYQTLIVPVMLRPTGGLDWYFLLAWLDNWDIATPVLLAGGLGWAVLWADRPTRQDRVGVAIAVAGLWFTVGTVITKQRGALDIIPQVPLVAVGVGVLIALVPSVSLQSVRNTLPDVRAQTAAAAVLLAVISVSFLFWMPYPPYDMTANPDGLAWLGGKEFAGCHSLNNRIGKLYLEAAPWEGRRRCASLRDFLGWLRG